MKFVRPTIVQGRKDGTLKNKKSSGGSSKSDQASLDGMGERNSSRLKERGVTPLRRRLLKVERGNSERLVFATTRCRVYWLLRRLNCFFISWLEKQQSSNLCRIIYPKRSGVHLSLWPTSMQESDSWFEERFWDVPTSSWRHSFLHELATYLFIFWLRSRLSRDDCWASGKVPTVLTLLKDAGETLKIKTCKFFTGPVEYLKRVVRLRRLKVACDTSDAVCHLNLSTKVTEIEFSSTFCNVFCWLFQIGPAWRTTRQNPRIDEPGQFGQLTQRKRSTLKAPQDKLTSPQYYLYSAFMVDMRGTTTLAKYKSAVCSYKNNSTGQT